MARPAGLIDPRSGDRGRSITAWILYDIYTVTSQGGATELIERLHAASRAGDRAERTLRTAAVLSEALSAAGAHPVLVGGGAVEVYTRSAYTTRDLDFVAAVTEEAERTMWALGFERDRRHWLHEELGLVVEFPGTTLAPAESVSIDVDGTELRIISREDLVVDRLASWKHWGWEPDGAAAVLLLAIHDDVDTTRLTRRARQEDVADALSVLQPLARRDGPVTAEELQRLRAELDPSEESP